MREIESAAGRNYWQTWARVAPRFEHAFAKTVPDHWRVAGQRTSWVDGKRARKAATRAAGGLVLDPIVLPSGERVCVCDDPQGAAFALMERRPSR